MGERVAYSPDGLVNSLLVDGLGTSVMENNQLRPQVHQPMSVIWFGMMALEIPGCVNRWPLPFHDVIFDV